MTALRILLVMFWLLITGYTLVTVANHGLNFFPTCFRDIGLMGWPGQFDLDFSLYLLIAALWIAWRLQFTAAGVLIAVFSPVGGMIFLSAYLLFIITTEKPNMTQLLLGKVRADALKHS